VAAALSYARGTVDSVSGCSTCEIPKNAPEMLVWSSDSVMVFHYLYESDENAGWLVVAPVRHITRWIELSKAEVVEVAQVLELLDVAVTEMFGLARTVVASLGWLIDEHLHIHCARVPSGEAGSMSADEVCAQLRERMSALVVTSDEIND
jgi:diadenosine tetraphosphate (Ap4A) HIT family hydrolase